MSTIVTRAGKGSALTWVEGDANFTNLNNDKLENITGESIGDLSDVDLTGVTNGKALIWNSTNSRFEVGDAGVGSIGDISDVTITTPSAGQFLIYDSGIWSNSNTIKAYKEAIHTLGTTDTPSIDVANGNVQTVSITSGLSLPAFTNASAGQSVTLLVSGTGTATGTGAYVFAGGSKTLTTSSVVSIFYDGTTYWTSIATDFQA